MTTEAEKTKGPGGKQSLCSRECKQTIKEGLYTNNPITCQVLGICSCLAVTNRVANALVMGSALIFVTMMSNLIVSLLRNVIPLRIRMIVEVAIIATFVIVFDQCLKAFYWDMSKQLGPYVGLIITNCIVMGRAEAFAMKNKPSLSMVDGIANGVGYAIILTLIAIFREAIGAGTISLPGYTVTLLADVGYQSNLLFVLAPGAFFTAGIIIWIVNAIGISITRETES